VLEMRVKNFFTNNSIYVHRDLIKISLDKDVVRFEDDEPYLYISIDGVTKELLGEIAKLVRAPELEIQPVFDFVVNG